MTSRKSEPSSAAVAPAGGPPLVALDSAVFNGVSVNLEAKLGSVSLSVERLLSLQTGDVVGLDSSLNDAVELYVGGALVGHGEIVAVDDSFGVRIVDISTAL